jgi:hypothetical protein
MITIKQTETPQVRLERAAETTEQIASIANLLKGRAGELGELPLMGCARAIERLAEELGEQLREIGDELTPIVRAARELRGTN